MRLIHSVAGMRRVLARCRAQGGTIGFVPTMGDFHEGHLRLMRRARRETRWVVVSLFVNPLQFGHGEDWAAYPRNLARDARLARAAGVDVVFAPRARGLYPAGCVTRVKVGGELTAHLCGARRPGHFDGVATVVALLLNVVQPDVLYLGQKDAQQVAVLRRLVRDLQYATRIVVVPTAREPDGLAMSSRNRYLSADDRRAAAALSRALRAGAALVRRGARDAGSVEARMRAVLAEEPRVHPEYVEVVDPAGLAPVGRARGAVLLAVAARVGRARLIDNMVVRAGL